MVYVVMLSPSLRLHCTYHNSINLSVVKGMGLRLILARMRIPCFGVFYGSIYFDVLWIYIFDVLWIYML